MVTEIVDFPALGSSRLQQPINAVSLHCKWEKQQKTNKKANMLHSLHKLWKQIAAMTFIKLQTWKKNLKNINYKSNKTAFAQKLCLTSCCCCRCRVTATYYSYRRCATVASATSQQAQTKLRATQPNCHKLRHYAIKKNKQPR